VTESEDVLRAALEAAGLSLQGIPAEQRAMFTSLTEEEVSRLIGLRAGPPPAEPAESAEPAEPVESVESTGSIADEAVEATGETATAGDAPA
jgi:hypothetical protein